VTGAPRGGGRGQGARAASRAPSVFRALLAFCAAPAALAAQDSTVALFDRAASEYQAARTVRATFEQTLTNAMTGTPQRSRGDYLQGEGSRFAVRFTDPRGDAVVNDGTSLWLYLPSAAKGQVIRMPSQATAGMDFLSALLSAPRTDYVVRRLRDETIAAHATTAYSLLPKRGDMPFTQATVWIGKADALIWQLETTEPGGVERRVRFTAVQTNAEIPPGAFTFVVPAGVKVIDQAALFGKKP
jgi:outer membrane lipoprotein carrier protein